MFFAKPKPRKEAPPPRTAPAPHAPPSQEPPPSSPKPKEAPTRPLPDAPGLADPDRWPLLPA